MRKKISVEHDAELDITSFMNLMIILVPVLLMGMVFSHITVLDLTLPKLSAAQVKADPTGKNQVLEVIIERDGLRVNYPAGATIKMIPLQDDKSYNYKTLQGVLIDVKKMLKQQGVNKSDILILSQPKTDYQTIVKTMDTVRSYKDVLVASVVDAALFPAISLGDAPEYEAPKGGK